MRRLGALVLVAAVGLAPAAQLAHAAPADPPSEHQSAQPQSQPAQIVPTPDQLGVSFERIKRELRETPPSPKRSSLLHLEFHVDVYGKAPKIDLLANVDLSPDGAVRYGGMTHREFLDVVTPQAFKAPPADLLSLFTMAIQQLTKKQDDNRK